MQRVRLSRSSSLSLSACERETNTSNTLRIEIVRFTDRLTESEKLKFRTSEGE